jgi:aspartyl aminopeptidase
VPEQAYFNHSNVPGGGTLGNISATQVPMHTVDVGLAQLAMHSACETAGAADTEYLIRAMTAAFSAKITEIGPETFSIELSHFSPAKTRPGTPGRAFLHKWAIYRMALR